VKLFTKSFEEGDFFKKSQNNRDECRARTTATAVAENTETNERKKEEVVDADGGCRVGGLGPDYGLCHKCQ
jgi:hypothetical protein